MDLPKFGADGFDNADYIKLGGKATDKTFLTAPFLAETAGPEAKKFIDAFKAKYNRDVDWMSANAYDAAAILIEAIAKAGPDRAKIRDYLAGMAERFGVFSRETGETRVAVELKIDGSGATAVDTGFGFADHMLTLMAFWASFDLKLACRGDLEVDAHHSLEDVAICLGEALRQALGDRAGIARVGVAKVPMCRSVR